MPGVMPALLVILLIVSLLVWLVTQFTGPPLLARIALIVWAITATLLIAGIGLFSG